MIYRQRRKHTNDTKFSYRKELTCLYPVQPKPAVKAIKFFKQTLQVITKLIKENAGGSAIKDRLKLEKLDVLFLYDLCIQPMDIQSRMLSMEIIEYRHDKKSTKINTS